ncbi:MAG TPA: hypothetical protein VE567_00560 [Sphingomonas sp.]|nr:hypothetical protein [Sphingomonas sp.]
MRDEYDDRIHQTLRHDFAANVAAIAASVAHAFDRLHERLYAAPWSQSLAAKEPTCTAKLRTH